MNFEYDKYKLCQLINKETKQIEKYYKFTQYWFHDNIALKNELHNYVNINQKLNILEIGNFEGLSACFFSDNYLDHDESKLYCVDPYYKTGTVSGITTKCIDENTENIFIENLNKIKNQHKVTKKKMTSDEFFENNDIIFDIIYLDGCHEPHYIKRDIDNAFKFSKKDSIIWMDDYGGNTTDAGPIKNHIDIILWKDYYNKFKILYEGYQLGIQIL